MDSELPRQITDAPSIISTGSEFKNPYLSMTKKDSPDPSPQRPEDNLAFLQQLDKEPRKRKASVHSIHSRGSNGSKSSSAVPASVLLSTMAKPLDDRIKNLTSVLANRPPSGGNSSKRKSSAN